MTKIRIQTISQIEYDTETNRQRLLSSWTKILGKGNGKDNKKKPKKIIETVENEGDVEWL